MLNMTVDRKALLKAINIVEKAVTENKIREVLSGIYIETFDNRAVLRGTDLELSINTEIEAQLMQIFHFIQRKIIQFNRNLRMELNMCF